jgi:phage shock protein PspC (stress-responsive transcriptional regulator)
MDAQHTQVALPLRSHTILGVCEALGEDFGINPTYLRVALAASVVWNLKLAVAAYLALGLVVLGSRLLFPKTKAVVSQVEAPLEQVATVANEQHEYAKAA